MSDAANIIRDAISTQVFPVINLFIIPSAIFYEDRPTKELPSLQSQRGTFFMNKIKTIAFVSAKDLWTRQI